MNQEYNKEIEKIIGGMQCRKDFEFCESRFENVCKAKDIGVELFLECLEEEPQECKSSLLMGSSYLCQSPLRVYIAKKLKK